MIAKKKKYKSVAVKSDVQKGRFISKSRPHGKSFIEKKKK